jgi:prepilin-type N-terminal cleavage/methylation domain-containing protein
MMKSPEKETSRGSPEKEEFRGYTMVEIMLAVGLISLLAVMAIPNLQHARRNALETAAVSGLKQLSEAEELYFDEYGYYTAGHDQWHDLRTVDAIDAKGYNRLAGRRGVFIRGYSIQLLNMGQYPQNYSIIAWPIERGLDLKTFYIISDAVVRDWGENLEKPITIY